MPYLWEPFWRELCGHRFDCESLLEKRQNKLIMHHLCHFLLYQVLSYTVTNMYDLTAKTRDFRDAMFNSTLPWQMIDSAAGRVSVIRCVLICIKLLVYPITIQSEVSLMFSAGLQLVFVSRSKVFELKFWERKIFVQVVKPCRWTKSFSQLVILPSARPWIKPLTFKRE